MRTKDLAFVVGCTATKDSFPIEYFPAVVPGAVQLDYAKAKNWGEYWYSENFKDYAQLEDLYWVYQTKAAIDITEDTPYLYLEGVDYEFDILINKEQVFHQEGMYTPVWLDLSQYKGNEILVQIRIYPRPIDPTGDPGTQQEARRCCKPPVSYGWDWHPRLIPLGLYQPAYICYKAPAHFSNVFFASRLSDALDEATVTADVKVSRPSKVRLTIFDRSGKEVASTEQFIRRYSDYDRFGCQSGAVVVSGSW